MHSSRMRIARPLPPYGDLCPWGVSLTDPLDKAHPETQPLDRDPWTEHIPPETPLWTETLQRQRLPRQRPPPGQRPSSRSCEQNDTLE